MRSGPAPGRPSARHAPTSRVLSILGLTCRFSLSKGQVCFVSTPGFRVSWLEAGTRSGWPSGPHSARRLALHLVLHAVPALTGFTRVQIAHLVLGHCLKAALACCRALACTQHQPALVCSFVPCFSLEHALSPAAQVWASKWNDRAWLSRRARGVPDSALFMAALIQQVCNHSVVFRIVSLWFA